jgi:lipopolysaccharide export system permease protein
MLGLGKLHSDSEIIALHAGGVSESRILRPIVSLAIPLALLIAFLSIYVRPWAYTQTYTMLAIAEASSDINRIKAGQFYLTRKSPFDAVDSGAEERGLESGLLVDGSSAQDRERAIFIESISAELDLEHVFIRTRTGDELQVISAQTGILVEQPESSFHILELDNARIFKRVADGPNFFARIDKFIMKVANEQPEPLAFKAKSVPSAQLLQSPHPKAQAEYQWRLSTPITTLLLALLAVPLSRSKPRQGRYARLLLAFVIYAAYYNLIGISRTWVEQQVTSTIWWAPTILAVIVALFYLPWHSLRVAFAVKKND